MSNIRCVAEFSDYAWLHNNNNMVEEITKYKENIRIPPPSQQSQPNKFCQKISSKFKKYIKKKDTLFQPLEYLNFSDALQHFHFYTIKLFRWFCYQKGSWWLHFTQSVLGPDRRSVVSRFHNSFALISSSCWKISNNAVFIYMRLRKCCVQ